MRLEGMLEISKRGEKVEDYLIKESEETGNQLEIGTYYTEGGIFEDSDFEEYCIKNKISIFELSEDFEYGEYIKKDKSYFLLTDDENENVGVLVPYKKIENRFGVEDDDGNDIPETILMFNQMKDASEYVKELLKIILWDDRKYAWVTFKHLKEDMQKAVNEYCHIHGNNCINLDINTAERILYIKYHSSHNTCKKVIKKYHYYKEFSLDKLKLYFENTEEFDLEIERFLMLKK